MAKPSQIASGTLNMSGSHVVDAEVTLTIPPLSVEDEGIHLVARPNIF